MAEAPPDAPVGPLARAFMAHGISSQDAAAVEAEVVRLAQSRVPAHTAVDIIRGFTLTACLRSLKVRDVPPVDFDRVVGRRAS